MITLSCAHHVYELSADEAEMVRDTAIRIRRGHGNRHRPLYAGDDFEPEVSGYMGQYVARKILGFDWGDHIDRDLCEPDIAVGKLRIDVKTTHAISDRLRLLVTDKHRRENDVFILAGHAVIDDASRVRLWGAASIFCVNERGFLDPTLRGAARAVAIPDLDITIDDLIGDATRSRSNQKMGGK